MIEFDAIFCDTLNEMMAELETSAGRHLTSKQMHEITKEAFSIRDEIDEEFFNQVLRRRLLTRSQIRKNLGNIWRR